MKIKAPSFPKMTKSKTLELEKESRVDTKMCSLAVGGGGEEKKGIKPKFIRLK